MLRCAESERPADDGGVARKPVLPDVVADDDDRRRTFALVLVIEVAAEERRHARDPKAGRGHLGDPNRLRAPLERDEVSVERAVCADGADRSKVGAPRRQVVEVQWPTAIVASAAEILNRDDAVAFVERQRAGDEVADDAECGCTDRDGDRQPEYADECQPGGLEHHPEPELEIERHSGEPGESAVAAERLLVILHPAERRQCAASCFVRLETVLAHEALHLHVQVERELFGYARFGSSAGEQEACACPRGVEPSHVVRKMRTLPLAVNRRRWRDSSHARAALVLSYAMYP